MCGVVGTWGQAGSDINAQRAYVTRAQAKIIQRGPDAMGVWADPENSLVFGHTRLSVVELSSSGAQPMLSKSGRYAISFNGEIYNHQSLRDELRLQKGSVPFVGGSDTKSLIEYIDAFGLERALKESRGMFAFALWDKVERKLFLARDRFGEKPLHYSVVKTVTGSQLIIGSQLSALTCHEAFNDEVDNSSVHHFLSYGYVNDRASIYENTFKVAPGCYLEFSSPVDTPKCHKYWNRDFAEIQLHQPISDEQYVERLEGALNQAISEQLLADVPLGIFLSGGIDSSLIAAIAKQRIDRNLKTFNIGFNDPMFNESHHAQIIADYLGTDHVTHMVSDEDLLDTIPKLGQIFDEPFADPSQIPTALLAKTAREHVTVALSGDGADELFYGYSRYQRAEDVWPKISHIPDWVKLLLSQGIEHLPVALINRASLYLSSGQRYGRLGEVIQNLKPLLESRDVVDLHDGIASAQRKAFFTRTAKCSGLRVVPAETQSTRQRLMLSDQLNYLPGDILVKTDRCAMAHSLETRAPFLDHRVVQTAMNLPDTQLRDKVGGKVILKSILSKHLPRELWDRPKKGFDAPIGEWLRGPMRAWAEDILFANRAYEDEFLSPKLIRRIWALHTKNHMNLQDVLWPILMLQNWHSTIEEQRRDRR